MINKLVSFSAALLVFSALAFGGSGRKPLTAKEAKKGREGREAERVPFVLI